MATKACDHCGGSLTGRQRFWCSDRCRRHEKRVTRSLLDPCEARWLVVGGMAHAGSIHRVTGMAQLLCGARPKRHIAHTLDHLGVAGYLDKMYRCEHCQNILRD